MKGLASCPWCPWELTVTAPTRETVVTQAQEAIATHNAEVGHLTKPGTAPKAYDRPRYRHGKPVS